MTPRRPPALVAVSHGTSSPEGRAAVRGLYDAVVAAVAERWPDAAHETRLCHVDVEQPDVPAALATLPEGEAAIIVPLLLSAGYHVHVDLAEAAAEAREGGREVVVAEALGPDDRLIAVLQRRLAEAGAGEHDPVVLVVAGSSDVRAVEACERVRDALAEASVADVSIGFLSAAEPRLPDAIAAARAAVAGEHGTDTRVAAASYLLAPGYFQDLAASAAPDVLAEPLLRPDDAPTELVDIVLDRYAEALARTK
ncbi:sirohydrochlorin chelatase [Agromyces bracchium]|uniref:Cobalamin biosynthesis protein CbiX n=1 Tax=Agromyces bracchium TaxID=88376 RepID=A0A6I3M0N2_9MICO|nr:CbiX/SirB N-terminal domain-containing protein [Agromyces bracchium]MTH66934.1 cobalamin biosynthesis protein CbiX [Agromyces bracchium]